MKSLSHAIRTEVRFVLPIERVDVKICASHRILRSVLSPPQCDASSSIVVQLTLFVQQWDQKCGSFVHNRITCRASLVCRGAGAVLVVASANIQSSGARISDTSRSLASDSFKGCPRASITASMYNRLPTAELETFHAAAVVARRRQTHGLGKFGCLQHSFRRVYPTKLRNQPKTPPHKSLCREVIRRL